MHIFDFIAYKRGPDPLKPVVLVRYTHGPEIKVNCLDSTSYLSHEPAWWCSTVHTYNSYKCQVCILFTMLGAYITKAHVSSILDVL